MAGENLVKVLQIAGAALGIPAAAAGTFAAYQNYVSNDGTCQKLRSNIVAIMERSVAPETKRTLLRKDVNEFDKLCGEGDPDARTIFHAAITPDHPAPAATETANATTADAGHGPAAAGAQPEPSSRRSQLQAAAVFGAPGTKEHYGWVALGRRQSGGWVPHFNGYTISDASLPPPGTVLSAQICGRSRKGRPTIRPNCRAGSRTAPACVCCRRAGAPAAFGPRSLRHHAREPDRARALEQLQLPVFALGARALHRLVLHQLVFDVAQEG